MDFTKKSCPVCSIRFKEDDDIVVCPKCGAPYHRDCYDIKGKCIFPELHKNKETWHSDDEEPETEETPESVFIICRHCGHRNSKDNIVCEQCGDFLTGPTKVIPNYFGSSFDDEEIHDGDDPMLIPPIFNMRNIQISDLKEFAVGVKKDEDFDGVTGEELLTYVGTNELYYGPVFSSIKHRDTSRFNIATLFFQGIWYFYRKQYVKGIFVGILTFIPAIVEYICSWFFGTGELWKQATEAITESSKAASYREYIDWIMTNCDTLHGVLMLLPYLLSLIVLVLTIIFACNANRNYYKHAIKKIKAIKEKHKDKDKKEILDIIREKGGINQGLAFMLVACEVIIAVALYI